MVAHFPAAAPHPPQNTFSPCPDPLGKEFFRNRKFPPAQPPRQNNKGNKSRGSEEKESRTAEISEKKESKNCNVSRLRCQCNHRRCRHPLAASSFARSPRPPLLGSRRSITSFSCTQHSALGAASSTPSPRHHPTHPPKPSRERVAASSFTRSPPPSLPRSLHQHSVAHTHKQGIYNPGIIFHHLSVALSLHGACRRNTAPRETHAHNTPHATPSTDKSCTSRTANIPHSTAPASKPRLDAGSDHNSHHWPIHPSKARCVQVFRHDNAKRAHNIPHADAEKQGLGIEGEKMLRERSSFFGASAPRSPRVSCTAVKCYFRALHSS